MINESAKVTIKQKLKYLEIRKDKEINRVAIIEKIVDINVGLHSDPRS